MVKEKYRLGSDSVLICIGNRALWSIALAEKRSHETSVIVNDSNYEFETGNVIFFNDKNINWIQERNYWTKNFILNSSIVLNQVEKFLSQVKYTWS